ncbi:uncharacterized protein LOC109546568 isoform X2 [Dendroctonus ponderosae]|uniref:uncharacterized protein LOC109546568 isoform X2 n=1 Tax=Dendroctonus ponderosae TaxID=77166 RepID=UPI00203504EA|nr:uncharacterized protein LOC109546568 isoform X2 [Dendroctonus ponderosae]
MLKNNALGLRNVTLYITPTVVQKGHAATFRCTYDLEGDTVYSVQWYRGSHEFYRYEPSGVSVTQHFSIPGVRLKPDLTNSNSTQVVLTDIEFNLAGNFSCEVTTENGPNMHIKMDSKSMSVVQLPEHPPQISVGREPLDYGDILRANCSSHPSRPPADLKFILNNITVHQSESAVLRRANVRDWSDLQLELQLSFIHFDDGRLVLQCVAQISSIYREVAELELESVRHPVPARVIHPSNSAAGTSPGLNRTIRLGAHSVLLAFVLLQAYY